MHNRLKSEDIGMDRYQVIRMRMYYGQKEIEESERYKKILRKSGDLGKMFVSSLPVYALIESVEPPNSIGRYSHVRVRVIKSRKKNSLWGGREYIAWFQARHRDDFSKKHIEPLESSLEAIIKHNLTPGDYVVVRQPLPLSEKKGRYEESVETMTGAFDKLLEVVKSAR